MTKPAGNERFVQLLEEHKRLLYKVASAYCAEAEDRRDLMQEIVIQLWRSFPRYDDRLKFSTWMYRIGMNVAISFLRGEGRRGRRETVALEGIDVIDTVAADRILGEAGDDVRLLQRLVSRLDEMSRALIVLYLEGYSHAEIAEILGITATNVGTRVNRIKSRLRDELNTP
ncbi:MAG TPA: sigma-70 family RNA polymerase sigma factor [Thermoanaerobaculia bacterium]|jgi:RNA polymerase sigma-70 factor (ECF subfamily)|nr:sigma-70 family RNA polymerase sigma factor [Thermoanaerobaculia bacterium]